MKTLHRRCAGVDVHSANVVACIWAMTKGKVRHEVRQFATSTRDLLALRDWFEAEKVTHVAMEATGVYWKPVWHILEEKFTLILANAAHVRNLQGRTSDVNDATWIADLLAHGLIRPSFVPACAGAGIARSDPDANATDARSSAAYPAPSKGAGGRQHQID
jgi:transposase